MKNEDSTRQPTIAEAADAVAELRGVLGRLGIVLPSLGLDALTLAAEPPRPLPIGGGREWDCEPEGVRVATAAERLSAATAHANARSRGEVS
ncbi:hypothetical protein [Streptomyces sp. 2RAF24]|uniref:hypothetical protein n=1 Tax=Streptomyces sp. 2RAF24 TaxID=3232997 RepID=UPI003F9673A9